MGSINKRQLEAARRAKLQYILDTHPSYVKIIDAIDAKDNKELQDSIEPVINEELKKARMIGVNIGWQGAMLQAYEKVKDMQSVEEIKACLKSEADKVRDKLKIPEVREAQDV